MGIRTFASSGRFRFGFCHALFVIVLFAMSTDSKFADAGCYHLQDYVVRTFGPDGNPLPANFRKLYDGGVFKYYRVPSGTPCDGPQCNSNPARSLASEPALMTHERITLSSLETKSLHYTDQLPVARNLPVDPLAFDSPTLDGLLRPPSL
jgi:hypothetical protein